MPAAISKSKYLAGLQCLKLLWTHYNAKEDLPEVDEATQAIFDQGHEVGRLAQSLFPGGVEVPWERNLKLTIDKSKDLLSAGVTVFEASFQSGGTYARADILVPVGNGRWDIVEVKSGTEVKPVNLHDVALQRYCYEGAGVVVRRCHLMHIDNRYVRQGNVEAKRLFASEDVTDQLPEYSKGIADRVAAMHAVIARKTCPQVDIGPHCSDPYPCPLMDQCWAQARRSENNIFTLYGLGAKAWDLYRKGVERNDQIPGDYRLSSRQLIQTEAERRGGPHVDASAVRDFLATLKPPLHFLDFETFMAAIPLIDRSRPYQQMPFQFSLHVADAIDAEVKHHSWLWDGAGDPRELMLGRLEELLGRRGSIVAYNASFEAKRLREAAEAFPKYKTWTMGVLGRIVDLIDPFRAFDVYYPAQHGSCSLKEVLPALTGKGYDDLAITGGDMASLAFLRVMFAKAAVEERERVRRNLEEYCGLDTYGMVEIVRTLKSMCA